MPTTFEELGFATKTFKTPRGFTYRYRYHAAKDASKSTWIILHGFQDSVFSWLQQVAFLTELGYGAVVPDFLGYGGTDKPHETEAYSFKGISDDFVAIMNEEKVEKFLVAGTDWGAGFAPRLSLYYPEKVLGHVQTGVPYLPPGPKIELDDINKMAMNLLGYEIYGYFHLLLSPDLHETVINNVDAWAANLHSEELLRYSFCPRGAIEDRIAHPEKIKLASYATPEIVQRTKDSLLATDYRAASNYYRISSGSDFMAEEEKHFTEEQKVIKAPMLWIQCTRDCCAPEPFAEPMKKYTTNLSTDKIDAGHWILQEKPQEWNKVVKKWLDEKSL